MKEIKDFIDMLDMHYEHWRKKLDNDSMEEAPLDMLKGDIATDALFYIFQTPEYVALKTLIDCQNIPHERPLKEPKEKPYCAGENCNATKENITHSVECMFEHFLAYTGDSAATPLFKAQLKRAYLHGRDSTKPKNLFCAAEDSPDFGLSDFEIFYCRICKNSILYQGQICKGREEKKEPKKQTLWEYIADEKDLRPKDLENYEIIDLISEYLEQNNV